MDYCFWEVNPSGSPCWPEAAGLKFCSTCGMLIHNVILAWYGIINKMWNDTRVAKYTHIGGDSLSGIKVLGNLNTNMSTLI